MPSQPLSFPGSSSVSSFSPSLPSPAPPGFHLMPPARPLASPLGLRPHGHSLPHFGAPSFSVVSRIRRTCLFI